MLPLPCGTSFHRFGAPAAAPPAPAAPAAPAATPPKSGTSANALFSAPVAPAAAPAAPVAPAVADTLTAKDEKKVADEPSDSAGSGAAASGGGEAVVDFDGPDAAAAAKLRNDQPMSLLGKRVVVQGEGSGVISNFSKSKFFGPST